MKIVDVLILNCGLILFLYGINLMSNSLKKISNNKLKDIFLKLTDNKIKGMAVGFIFTAIIQSSSATTVILVGLVNAGILSVSQTIPVIIGANMGTTATGFILALNVQKIIILLIIIGLMLYFTKLHLIGGIISGLGLLFLGLEIIGFGVLPLKNYKPFLDLLINFENPIVGVIIGVVFTSIIQSSSASVGILQRMAGVGIITLDNSVYLILGFSIGTCVTAIISSFGMNSQAKQVAKIHLNFNIISTIIFVIILNVLPIVSLIEVNINNKTVQIACFNFIYKLISSVIMLPFINILKKISTKKICKNLTKPVYS